MDLHMQGKTALITGGSVGIGLGVAKAFAREGANVLIAARNEERLEQSANEIRALNPDIEVHTCGCDVATAEGCAALAQAAEKIGGVDYLINNAGTGSNETVLNSDDEKWMSFWELHVMAAVRLARSIAPMMEARGGGAIIHNASICATQPLWYEPIYNTTKAALLMFSKCLATELIPKNIRVNTINPGLIRTPDWENTAQELAGENWEAHLQSVADEHATIKRFGTVEELADFFVFLCSDRASYCVGSTFYVDGGMLRSIS